MGFSGCGEEYFATFKLRLKGIRPESTLGRIGELRSIGRCIDQDGLESAQYGMMGDGRW